MSLFAIGDLHLAIGEPDKTMEAFGGRWIGYVDKIRRGFDLLHEDDTCVICGDFCWAMSLAEALPDFQFLNSLPGKKLMVKGNHDYWWGTVYKMKKFFVEQNGLSTIDFLYNNAYETESFVVCGSRGWWGDAGLCPSGVDYEKIVAREALRELFKHSETRVITCDSIQDAVANYYGLSVEDLKSPKRNHEITVPRQIAMYLAREMMGLSLTRIGDAFGGRHYTTVMSSISKVEDSIKQSPSLVSLLDDIRRMIKNPT